MSGFNIQSASNLVGSASNVLGIAAKDIGGASGASAPRWMDKLHPASFRGVPFGVLGGEIRFGRKNVLHQYPLRDTVWVEDMGRQARRITMEGFLVGDDVIAQREKLIAAVEASGDGKLVHPTLGEITVGVLDAEAKESWDHGRVFTVHFSFIEGGQRIFPGVTTSTAAGVTNSAVAVDAAAKADFKSRVAAALRNGAAAVQAAVNAVTYWSRKVQRLINDATNIKHLVQDAGSFLQALGGGGKSFGRRFDSGAPAAPVTTQQQRTGAGSAACANVAVASANLATSANALSGSTTDAYGNAAQALVAAALATSVNPSDGLRLMSSAAVFAPVTLPASDAIGLSINTVTNASADLFRRAAVAAMARASSAYQPLSYDDAARMRAQITQTLDNEIRIAGDQNEDATFNALLDLRTAVTQDLNARGANLARMVQFSTGSPLPAMVLAYRLYGDIARADQLIEFAHPIHPAFMPTSMRVLSA